MENHLVGFPGPHSLFSRTLEMPRCPPRKRNSPGTRPPSRINRANAGVQTQGRLAGASLLLLTTTGAKSGEKRTRPLGFIQEGDVYVVVGSNWGQETNPAWVANIQKDPNVTAEVGTETFAAVAEVTTGDERRRLFDAVIAAMPPFAEYEKIVKTREIPVVKLTRVR